jgi:protease-4
MPSVIRLLLWILLLPFRLVGWSLRRAYVSVWGYSALRLRVHGRLPDKRGPLTILGALTAEPPGPALLEVLVALDRARRDPRIRLVLVELGPLETGLARAEELRVALSAVKAAGKRVVVYVEEAGLVEYSAAIGGSEIGIAPSGSLNVMGIASEVLLVKGLLDKVGVRAWMRARGKYKSMRETFTEPEMTPENREMTESIVRDLHAQLVEAISAARGIAPDDVRRRLDDGPFTAAEAKESGLVDTVAYLDEVEAALRPELGKHRFLSLGSYLGLSSHLVRGRPTRVALVEVTGHIKSGRSVPGQDGMRATGSRRFVEEVNALAEDPKTRAILLRVDSPGGSALASDVMWHALMRAAGKKPIVVSMVDVAASGGYFVAGIKGAPVLSSHATVTGSIGVVAGKFDASELFERLGVKREIVQAGRRAAFFSASRGFTDDELQKLESDLDAHYHHFVSRMAEGRGRTPEEIDRVAQGRVWTGRQALEIGLVDERGGLLTALDKVRALLRLHPTAPLALVSAHAERRRLPLRIEWRVPESVVPDVLAAPFRLSEWFGAERALALLPFDIRFR